MHLNNDSTRVTSCARGDTISPRHSPPPVGAQAPPSRCNVVVLSHRVVRGLSWPAGWVGLGCVGNGSKICVFSGLGWVMGLKWQMCEKYCQPRKLNQLNSLRVACRPNMTVMLVVLWVFTLLRYALAWWWWWYDVHKLIFLRQASCCSMYGGSVWYGSGWVDGNRPTDNSAFPRRIRSNADRCSRLTR